MAKNMRNDQMMRDLIRGRTLAEQVDYVAEHGTHGVPDQLRQRVLGAVDIYRERTQAENVVLFGCYLPYRMPLSLKAYLTLLDRLGIEYTFLDKEYCCGLPWVETATTEEVDEATRTATAFIARNVAKARECGASNIVYFCNWCAYLGKLYSQEGWPNQVYYADLVLQRLSERKLRVPPSVIGYYEGCHSRNRAFAPGIELDWAAYREVLGRIEGLKVIDLPNTCCVQGSEKVIAKAESQNLDTLVCSCPACYSRLKSLGRGRVQLKYLPEILLAAVEG